MKKEMKNQENSMERMKKERKEKKQADGISRRDGDSMGKIFILKKKEETKPPTETLYNLNKIKLVDYLELYVIVIYCCPKPLFPSLRLNNKPTLFPEAMQMLRANIYFFHII